MCYNGAVSSTGQERLRAKVARVEEALTKYYGERVWRRENYSADLTGGLVATILSQNTSDLNSGRAFASLRAAFPGGWDDVRRADTVEIADSIRAGGLADVKASRIKAILQDLHERTGVTSLECLSGWSDEEIRKFLISFKGIGPKTAACILMFNLGRPILAVDTHVHRVAKRLGLIGPKVTPDQAHALLQELLEDGQVYSFHVHMIEHGRKICHAQRPQCDICPVQSECDFYAGRVWAESKSDFERIGVP